MLDLVYLVVIVAFFALALAYIAACGALQRGDREK